ncbi:MAG: type IV pilus assembly protein PilF [Gammaproteobacteria bacterium]|jgi:type IV pilus assembly protein PilF
MRKFTLIYLVIMIIGLTGCDPATIIGSGTSSETIKPSVTTNNAAEANLRLGIAYMREGEYEKALSKFQRAQEADKNYPPTYNALGILYQRLGDKAKAEEFFKKALSLNSNDAPTLNNYGQFLCQNSRFDEAETAFMKAARNPLYSTPEIALSNAGTCAMLEGNFDVAESHFRNALERNPRVAVALLQMSQLSYEASNHLSARAYLQRYLEISAHTAKSLWLGINIETELGDKNALSSYNLLLKNKFPDSKEAQLLKDTSND